MAGGRGPDDAEHGETPRLSLRQRLLLALPRFGGDGEKEPLGARFRQAVLKPVEPTPASKARAADEPMSVEELEAAVASIDDKERLIGFLAAPLAAIVTVLVVSNLIADDPAARFKNGRLNPAHVSLGLYHELAAVLVVLTALIVLMAMLRKRFFLGIAMALFGLGVFDLHGWGFGIPFVAGGAWYLVRAYRLSRELKEATGEAPGGRSRGSGGGRPRPNGPRPNKRYTPPSSPPKRSPPAKPEDEKRAG
jgi:hypothetical protein